MAPAVDSTTAFKAVTSLEHCTTKTVQQLRVALGFSQAPSISDKGAEIVADSTDGAPKRTRQAGRPSDRLDPRQKQNIATDLFNFALKTFTERVRKDASTSTKSGRSSPRALREIANPPAPCKTTKSKANAVSPKEKLSLDDTAATSLVALTSLAECSLIACHYLSRPGNQVNLKSTCQLQSGMLALSTRLLALGLDKYTVRLLALIKRSLHTCPGSDKDIKETKARETLSSLLAIDATEIETPERLKMLSSYMVTIMRVMTGPAYATSISAAIGYLDPARPTSPCMITLRSSNDHERLAKDLETQAQCLTVLSACPSLPSLSAFLLRSFAIQTRKHWWTLATHSVDIQNDLLNPFCNALATLARHTIDPSADVYATASAMWERTIQDFDFDASNEAHAPAYAKLYQLMEQLGPTDHDRTRWSCKLHAPSDTTMISDILALTTALSSDTNDLALNKDPLSIKGRKAVKKAALEFGKTNMAGLPDSTDVLRKSASRTLHKGAKISKEDKLILSEIIFSCSVIKLLSAGRSSDPVTSSLDVAKTIECCVAAAELWMMSLGAEPEVVFEPLSHCAKSIEVLGGNMRGSGDNAKLALRLSNAFWIAFQKLVKTGTISDMRLKRYLELSLQVLEDQTATTKDAAFFITKLERLSDVHLRLGEADQGCQALSKAIQHHLYSTNMLCTLESPIESIPDSFDTKEGRCCRRLLQLQLKAIEEGGLRQELYDQPDLPPDHRAVLFEYHLVVLMGDLRSTGKAKQSSKMVEELGKAIQFLFGYYRDLKHLRSLALYNTVLTLQIHGINLLEASQIFRIETETADAAFRATMLALGNKAEHLLSCIDFAKCVLGGRLDEETIDSQLEKWMSEDDTSMTFRDHAYDPQVFCIMLEAVASHFEMSAEHLKAYKALSILQRLAESQETTRAIIFSALIRLSAAAVHLGHPSAARQHLDQAQSLVKLNDDQLTPLDLMDLQLVQLEAAICAGEIVRAQDAYDAFHVASTYSPQRGSDKTSYYICQARAGFLCSRLALFKGEITMALHFAKESIRLYKSLDAAIGRQNSVPNSTSDVEDLTSRVAKLGLAAQSDSQDLSYSLERRGIQIKLFHVYCHMVEMHMQQGVKMEAEHFLNKANALAVPKTLLPCQMMTTELSLRLATLSCDVGKINTIQQHEFRTPRRDHSLLWIRYRIASAAALTEIGAMDEAFSAYDDALCTLKTFPETLLRFNRSIATKSPGSGAPQQLANAQKLKTKSRMAVTQRHGRRMPKDTELGAGDHPVDTNVVASMLTAEIHSRRIRRHLSEGRVDEAREDLGRLLNADLSRLPMQTDLLQVQVNLGHVGEQLASDVRYNTIPEAAILLPCLAHNSTASNGTRPPPKKTASKAVSKMTKAKKGQSESCSITEALRGTTELILTRTSKSLARSALSTTYLTCSLALTAMMLLSAVDRPALPNPALDSYPSKAVCFSQLPQIDALQRQITFKAVDQSRCSLQSLLKIAIDAHATSSAPYMNPTEFQRDYVNILPKAWVVVSIGLSQNREELRLTRMECGQLPFVLQLPMTRQSGSDIDGSSDFDFETGIKETRDIIECSNFTCHTPVDTSVKGAKTKWWTEREALDRRLHELLVNIENIWLGGFKGVFSLHQRRADLLARFRKSLDNILDRHLPSRSSAAGAKVKEKPTLNSNVLELFIGLAHAGTQDIEEQVLDLLHFVLDTLSFNGEANAYDEVDIDGMAIDILDAMRKYCEADIDGNSSSQRHLILVLDKDLHAIPWESLACLQNQSVSRVGSMLHIRERILAMGRQSAGNVDQCVVSRRGGAYVLNASGDLGKTQALLEPALAPLQDQSVVSGSSWKGIVGRTPSSDEMTAALSTNEIFLYFGHGSGNQYISNRSVRRLQRSSKIVWLMGCSSGTVSENGELEPTSVPLSYMVAGEAMKLPYLDTPVQIQSESTGVTEEGHKLQNGLAGNASTQQPAEPKGRDGLCMAVLATLWDVTDKDIDRYSLKVGENWGLFAPSLTDDAQRIDERKKVASVANATVAVPKTPGRKAGKTTVTKTPAPRGMKTPPAACTGMKTSKGVKLRGNRGQAVDEELAVQATDGEAEDTHSAVSVNTSLSMAVAQSRDACYLRYMNGAAPVVYGIPVYLGE